VTIVGPGDASASLLAFLRTARGPLALDNCEHVIDAAVSLAETIFSRAPGVHVLATNRETLRVEGEHAHWVFGVERCPASLHRSRKIERRAARSMRLGHANHASTCPLRALPRRHHSQKCSQLLVNNR
jgi:predicted ATPase